MLVQWMEVFYYTLCANRIKVKQSTEKKKIQATHPQPFMGFYRQGKSKDSYLHVLYNRESVTLHSTCLSSLYKIFSYRELLYWVWVVTMCKK